MFSSILNHFDTPIARALNIIKPSKDQHNQRKLEDVFMIRQAIRINYDTICEYYKTEHNKTLYSKNIITPKKYEHLKRQEKEYGTIQMCEVLVDYLLEEASNEHVIDFMNVLKLKQYGLYRKILSVENRTLQSFTQDIKGQLKKAYDEKQYHRIEVLPGEEFELNLKEEHFFVPLVFETKVRKTSRHFLMREKKCHYVSTRFESIEAIIGSLLKPKSQHNDDEARVVLITAEAGCGKTVSIHRMVCQWMDESDPHLAQYDMLIFIPLRNVDTDESLTTMLSDEKPKSTKHKGGLHYIKGKHKLQALGDYLGDKIEGSDKKVLFLLDGLDEVDIEAQSDLFKLITGISFPGAKLIITSRPEGKFLKTLVNFYPDYKISITGAKVEDVKKYLTKMMTKEYGPSKDEITTLINKYEEQIESLPLLTVPLYLTFVGVMFNQHWAQYANFKDFHVPTTITSLLNSTLSMLLTRWMKRDSNYSHIKQVKFGRHPYHQTNIPNDILNKLHSFANMSYFFLKKKQYDFTTTDLQQYFIDIDDIIASGLFCHSSNKFSYRHKLLQEFMAALYLIHPMCTETFKTPTEQGTFDNIINKSDTFLGLKHISTFVFEMSPRNALDIIHQLKGKLQLKINSTASSKRLHGIKVGSLLELCNECNDKNVNDAFISLLSVSKVCFTDKELPDQDISLYKTFFRSITTDQAASLLLSWYNIHMYPIENGWAMENGDNSNTQINDIIYDSIDRSLRIKCLDITLMLLLQRFTLPQVQSLFVDYSWENVPDMITIEKMFPNITKLFVGAYFAISSYELTKLNIPGSTSHQLTSLQHISYPLLKYSHQSQQLLLQQSQLETLHVDAASIHAISNRQQQQLYWPKLHTLKLNIKKLVSNELIVSSDPEEYNEFDLCHIFQDLPQLTVLSISWNSPVGGTMTTLLPCIQEHLTRLKKLHLQYVLDSQSLPVIFPVIRNMKKLTNLGLYYYDMDRIIANVVKGLSTVNNIKRLEILYRRNKSRSEAQTTMNKTIHYMNYHYPDMSIEVSCTKCHLGYLQPYTQVWEEF